jgi:hypothetical protein
MQLTGRLLVSGGLTMQTVRYVYWQDEDGWLGYLEEYPDCWTQGDSLDELREQLKDLYSDLTSGQIPGVRRVGELTIS